MDERRRGPLPDGVEDASLFEVTPLMAAGIYTFFSVGQSCVYLNDFENSEHLVIQPDFGSGFASGSCYSLGCAPSMSMKSVDWLVYFSSWDTVRNDTLHLTSVLFYVRALNWVATLDCQCSCEVLLCFESNDRWKYICRLWFSRDKGGDSFNFQFCHRTSVAVSHSVCTPYLKDDSLDLTHKTVSPTQAFPGEFRVFAQSWVSWTIRLWIFTSLNGTGRCHFWRWVPTILTMWLLTLCMKLVLTVLNVTNDFKEILK